MCKIPKWLVVFLKDFVFFVVLDKVPSNEFIVDDGRLNGFLFLFNFCSRLQSFANFLIHLCGGLFFESNIVTYNKK